MANDSSNTKYWVIAIIITVIICIVVSVKYSSSSFGGSSKPASSEGFEVITDGNVQQMTIENRGQSPPNLVNLPVTTRSNLPGLNGQSILGTPQDFATQAAPAQPTNAGMGMMNAQTPMVDMASLGSAQPLPLTTMQASDALSQLKKQVGGGAPEYQEPVLPIQDIGNMSTDPTNPMSPENFMYTRTIFAPLKRQYGNGVDFIRGDIDVRQEYRGWFDVRPATNKDIVDGYFASFLDIGQQTAVRDAQYTRTMPAETLYSNAINPGGDGFRSVYRNV
jgi:hypothetical protein